MIFSLGNIINLPYSLHIDITHNTKINNWIRDDPKPYKYATVWYYKQFDRLFIEIGGYDGKIDVSEWADLNKQIEEAFKSIEKNKDRFPLIEMDMDELLRLKLPKEGLPHE